MNASMGIALLDANQNQRFDILVTNFEHEQIALYENQGGHFFRHASRQFGLHRLEARVVGFGVVAADWDGDGDEDLMLTSGHVQYYTPRGTMHQPAVLLENCDGRFVRRIPDAEYFHQLHVGRGVAVGDLDNNGFLDIVITHLEDPPVVIQTTPDQPRSWLRIHLVGTESCRTPIGAIATVTSGERTMVRQLYGGGSYLSQSQPELFFHWPEEDPVDVQVEWPSGKTSRVAGVAPGQRLIVVEP
jgi:enediyne biosynthesis protein E4